MNSNLGEGLERNAEMRLLYELVEDGTISVSKAAEKAKVTETEFLEVLKEFNLICDCEKAAHA